MKFGEYLKHARITQAEAAKRLGISVAQANRLSKSHHVPKPHLAKKIVTWSRGAITLEELIWPEDFPDPPLKKVPEPMY